MDDQPKYLRKALPAEIVAYEVTKLHGRDVISSPSNNTLTQHAYDLFSELDHVVPDARYQCRVIKAEDGELVTPAELRKAYPAINHFYANDEDIQRDIIDGRDHNDEKKVAFEALQNHAKRFRAGAAWVPESREQLEQLETTEQRLAPKRRKGARRGKYQVKKLPMGDPQREMFVRADLTDKQCAVAELHWALTEQANIARELGLDRKTVSDHVKAIERKMARLNRHSEASQDRRPAK
jgi:DNA-binding NarL/FixJ family response regulator